MKLIYIANARIPTEKAHGIQIMKMCEAFAREGVEVELVVPQRRTHIKSDPFTYYGVEQNFKIKKLFTIDLVSVIPKLGFWIETLVFSLMAMVYLLFKRFLESADSDNVVIYSRDKTPLYFLSFLKDDLYWEVHSVSRNFMVNRIIKHLASLIVVSQGIKDYFVDYGVSKDDILIAHDAVDLNVFGADFTRFDARRALRLPQREKVVGFVGKLKTMGENKGVEDLIEAFSFLSHENSFLLLVGINKNEVDEVKELCEFFGLSPSRYKIVLPVRHTNVVKYLKACDVLVMNYPDKLHYTLYMSPMKLFEYMSSKRPIVASRLPAIREVLEHEKNAILVEPGNPVDLADAIKRLLYEDTEIADKIATRAFQDVSRYTWAKRAREIINLIDR